MQDTNPRPMLTNAHEAAEELLIRKVEAGDMTPDVAKDMATTGFTAATRVLSELRTRGMSEQCITESFQRQLDRARVADDVQRVIAAEFSLAVWDGMQRDLAAYLRATSEPGPNEDAPEHYCQGNDGDWLGT